MASAEQVHFSAVVEGLGDRFVREYLEQARTAARMTASLVASERHRAAARRALEQGREP
jgi:hypothetical protein